MKKLLVFCAVLAASLALSQAAWINMTWDPATNNADGSSLTDLDGYKVYQGATSRNYTVVTDVGLSTNLMVTNLPTGKTTYFAVTAYNNSTNEGALSDELVWAVPPVPGMTTVKSVTYNVNQSKATIVFNTARLTENGTPLTNAVALWVRSVNFSGTITNTASVSVAATPAVNTTITLTVAPNSGYWAVSGAVSNSWGQMAPWGTTAYVGTSVPGKPGHPKAAQFQY